MAMLERKRSSEMSLSSAALARSARLSREWSVVSPAEVSWKRPLVPSPTRRSGSLRRPRADGVPSIPAYQSLKRCSMRRRSPGSSMLPSMISDVSGRRIQMRRDDGVVSASQEGEVGRVLKGCEPGFSSPFDIVGRSGIVEAEAEDAVADNPAISGDL